MSHKKYADVLFLNFIKEHKEAHGGESPTIRQVAEALGITSTSLVAYRIDSLIREGRLTRGQRGWGFPNEVYKAEAGEPDSGRVAFRLDALAYCIRFLDTYAIPRLGGMTTALHIPVDFLDMMRQLVSLYPGERERLSLLEAIESGIIKAPEVAKAESEDDNAK